LLGDERLRFLLVLNIGGISVWSWITKAIKAIQMFDFHIGGWGDQFVKLKVFTCTT